MPPDFLKVQNDVVLLHAKVRPRALRNAIGEPLGGELKISITAPPVDSAANEALMKFLAEVLHCPRNALQIIRGQTARHKVIAIRGLSVEEAAQKLKA